EWSRSSPAMWPPEATKASGSAPDRQFEAGEEAAQIFAFLQPHRPAIYLGDVADDGEAEAGAGLLGIKPRAPIEDALALGFGDAAPVILDLDLDAFGRGLHRHEHAAAAIFGGILDQIAEHFVEILALDPNDRLLVA